MITAARLVIQFQNKIYESKDVDEPKTEFRESVKDLEIQSATKFAAETGSERLTQLIQSFKYQQPDNLPKFATIQYKVGVSDIDKVRKKFGRSNMSNKEIGEKTFKYYYDRECSQ
jgi:hypothetical protein